MQRSIVILGTGGTIAGTATGAADAPGYRAAQLGVAQLVAAVPALAALPVECEQVAQLDSKDMDHATWQRLAQRVAEHLARADVQGVVITHGSDTLEETAYFLHRVLAPAKPVVLTAAMRPATAPDADGPRNLLDAAVVARSTEARGVSVVMAGRVFHPAGLHKAHPRRLDAFEGGEAGPLARLEQGVLRCLREWPAGVPFGIAAIARDVSTWPRVEICTSHAGADGRLVEALVLSGVRGLVVAGTGNGTVHCAFEAALLQAQAAGVRVLRSSRCAWGGVVGDESPWPAAAAPTPVQARIDLLLELLATRQNA